jgi:hypothetical protein
MKRLSSYIKIGVYTFPVVVQVSIERSWQTLTDTCTITVPRKIAFEGKAIDTLIKRGDKVEVYLGYDDENQKEFEGYVRDVVIDTPITIHCEDAMYLLKQTSKTISYESVTLKQLLTDIVPSGIEFEAVDVNLGQFRIKRASAAKVLAELRKTYKLQSFFKDGKLYSGLAYPPALSITTHKFDFQKNIKSQNLEYRRAEEVKLRLKGISILPDNTKIEVEVGDKEGELRTFTYYNLQKAELKKLLDEEIKKLRYDGWFGSFTTFGQPNVQHGDFVELTDNKLQRTGTYLVKKTKLDFGQQGFSRENYLDRQTL